MNELLEQVLSAYGGIDRWNHYVKVATTIV
jgi:hypothetical protein